MKNRINDIYSLIKNNHNVKVKDLAKKYNVTEKTIRLNLQQLEDSGLIIRTHGGATLSTHQSTFPDDNYNIRAKEQKQEIAKEAQKYIKPYFTIVLDDGTTNFEIAKQLEDIPLTVITNDFEITNYLIENRNNINIYFVGGTVNKRAGTTQTQFHTNEEIKLIKKLHADLYFAGVNSINEKGYMIFNKQVRLLKRTFMSISKQTICVADSEKFNKSGFLKFANFNEISSIITDSNFKKSLCKRYANKNVNIIVVDKNKEIKHAK